MEQDNLDSYVGDTIIFACKNCSPSIVIPSFRELQFNFYLPLAERVSEQWIMDAIYKHFMVSSNAFFSRKLYFPNYGKIKIFLKNYGDTFEIVDLKGYTNKENGETIVKHNIENILDNVYDIN